MREAFLTDGETAVRLFDFHWLNLGVKPVENLFGNRRKELGSPLSPQREGVRL